MARLTPAFSTDRVVRQYAEEYYLPAAANYAARAANRGALGLDLSVWRESLSKHWPALRFGSAEMNQQGEQYFFQVQVYLAEVDPAAVRVEMYAEGQNGNGPVRQTMERGQRLADSPNGFIYSLRVPATRPAADYTPRLIPYHVGAHVPLETPLILWHDSPGWR